MELLGGKLYKIISKRVLDKKRLNRLKKKTYFKALRSDTVINYALPSTSERERYYE